MYKSQLQEFAQKSGWTVPQYDSIKQGLPHLPRFQASVEVNGVKYESEDGFPNLKAAEHSAAKKALDSLTGGANGASTDASGSSMTGLCKNVLQEYAQRNGFSLPIYQIEITGPSHNSVFAATVEIGGVLYKGGTAKSKKEAEVKAARTAILAIKELAEAAPSDDYVPPQSGKKRVRAAKNKIEKESPRRKPRV
ncbi:double-stranded RNA-binding protein 8 [Selaginella moellendorffii]|uniref:double-stranded RNA-binding protein 8 n=1 Tax=Selaginella moellendorffii TaxID=88036 RepID=UPI000D1C8E7B|nr:double-stranded RNA-binding protein 8 [Selaginella moellendorffii]|eukprot:XP_024537914.1 double-stranded RNA-binding protein 8 [Selaginella moellendorffii]